MKKTLGLMLVLLLFFSVALVQSQVTIPSSSDFYALLFQSSSDSRQIVYKAPYAAWKNNTGHPVSALRSDTTAMKVAFGSYQKAWMIAVKDTASAGAALGLVTFRKFAWKAGGFRDITVTVSKLHWTEITGLIPNTIINVAPFDSCYRGASFTFGYMTTQFQ